MTKQLSNYVATPTGRTVWISPVPVTELKLYSECRTAALCSQCHTSVSVDARKCSKCQREFSN